MEKNKLRKGRSEKVNRSFKNKNNVILKLVYCSNLSAVFRKYFLFIYSNVFDVN